MWQGSSGILLRWPDTKGCLASLSGDGIAWSWEATSVGQSSSSRLYPTFQSVLRFFKYLFQGCRELPASRLWGAWPFPAGLRLDTLLIKSQQASGRCCVSCVLEAGGWCWRQAGRLISHLVRCGWDPGSSLPTPAATPLPGLDRGRMMMFLLLFSLQVMSDSLSPMGNTARQAPLSMRFPRQEYWSGLPFPFPGDLPDPGMEPMSPALAGRFFYCWATSGTSTVLANTSRMFRGPSCHLFSSRFGKCMCPYRLLGRC